MKPSSRRLAGAVLALLCCACGPKLVREPVFKSENGMVEVERRRLVDDGEPVPRGYKQPAIISEVRLSHILAQLVYEDEDGAQHAVLRSEHLYDVTDGMVKAFAAAGPDDEVVVRLLSVDRRLGIFTVERVTAFRAHFEPEFLVLELFAVEEDLERVDRTYSTSAYEVPTQLPDTRLPVKLVPGDSIALRPPRGFQVAWRDPVFARPVSLSVRGGQLRRRTILMEAEPEDEAPELVPDGPEVPPAQRAAQLEALDQLDERRRNGEVSEAEFQRLRRLVLDGRLEEAGFGTEP